MLYWSILTRILSRDQRAQRWEQEMYQFELDFEKRAKEESKMREDILSIAQIGTLLWFIASAILIIIIMLFWNQSGLIKHLIWFLKGIADFFPLDLSERMSAQKAAMQEWIQRFNDDMEEINNLRNQPDGISPLRELKPQNNRIIVSSMVLKSNLIGFRRNFDEANRTDQAESTE